MKVTESNISSVSQPAGSTSKDTDTTDRFALTPLSQIILSKRSTTNTGNKLEDYLQNSFTQQARLRGIESQLLQQQQQQQHLQQPMYMGIGRKDESSKEIAPLAMLSKKEQFDMFNHPLQQQNSGNKNQRSLPRIRDHLTKSTSNALIEANNTSISSILQKSKQQFQHLNQLTPLNRTLPNSQTVPSIVLVASPTAAYHTSQHLATSPSESNLSSEINLQLLQQQQQSQRKQGNHSDRRSLVVVPDQWAKKEQLRSSFSIQTALKTPDGTSKKDSPKKSQFLNTTQSSLMLRKSIRDSQVFESNTSFSSIGLTSPIASTKKLQDFFVKRVHGDADQIKRFSKKIVDEQPDDSNNKSPVPPIIKSQSRHSKNLSMQLISFEDIQKSLHMEVTSAFSDNPRSRGDLKQMIDWFERFKKRIEEEYKSNESERRRRLSGLIHVCFEELQQQIRIDFSERADLLRRVWVENVKYYENFIDDFETMRLKISISADSEYNRVHECYKSFIKEKDMQVESAQAMQQAAELRLQEVQKELAESQTVQKRFKDDLNKFKKICFFLKKKLNQATMELEGLRDRQNDRIKYTKTQFLSDFYKDQLFQAKQSSKGSAVNQEDIIANLLEQLRLANEEKSKTLDTSSAQQQLSQSQQQHSKEARESIVLDEDEEEGDNESNFVFEYQDGGDVVQSIAQLNAVVFNTEIEAKRISTEAQVEDDLRLMYTQEMCTQTDLALLPKKYDAIMFDNATMDDMFDFYAYKQQMDEIAANNGADDLLAITEDTDNNNNSSISSMKVFFDQMNSIKEEQDNDNSSDMKSRSRSSSSRSSNSSSSSSRKSEDGEESSRSQQKDEVDESGNPTSDAAGYEDINGFKKRASIRHRLSISQNLFNSNRHLSLSLEQYLGNSFVNETMAVFGPTNAVGSVVDEEGKVIAVKRGNSMKPENNPMLQKKRMLLREKLNAILNPMKIKKVLDDAGLKVTSSSTETKLEKFLKIYQLSQFKGQELQGQLKEIQRTLTKTEEDFQKEQMELISVKGVNDQQGTTITRLEEELRIMREKMAELAMREAELEKRQLENEGKDEEMKAKNQLVQPRIYRARRDREATKMVSGSTAFHLGKKVNIEWEFQKQQNSGKVIVERAKDKKMAKFSNFLTLKTLLKQIAMFYNERMASSKENAGIKDIELANFAYNYLSSQYGVKKIADQKFLILILSVKKYSQILRINMFAKFLGLQEAGQNYSNDEFNKYIDVLDFVNHVSQAGSNYTNNESEQRYLVPYIKAVHYISQFGDSRMKSEENAELRRDVEAMKLIDANKVAVVDFDSYLTRLLASYRILVNRAKQYVINAFNACDLDGNRKCNFTEWSLLNRHIEPAKFDDDQLESVFEQNADILDEDGEKNLSFDKFAVVSLEFELFSDEAQNRYLDIPSASLNSQVQLKEKYEAVLTNWTDRKHEFEARFKVLQNIEQSAIDDWLTIISVLDEKLASTPFSVANSKPLLIAYSILDKESSMLEKDNLETLHQRAAEGDSNKASNNEGSTEA